MINNVRQIFKFIPVYIFLFCFPTGCEKEVSTSPIEEEIPKAFLFVDAEPAGSAIYLNSKNSGRKTPDFITFLEEGSYQITLKKKYFRDTTFNVILKNNDTLNVYVDYFQNPLMFGKINFNSAPTNAEIFLNDSSTGLRTPASINKLTPGKYNVRYKFLNHRDSNLDLIVESNKTTNSYAQLRDTSKWIDYQIANSGIKSNLLTSISVDNYNTKWIGTSNLGLMSFDELEFNNYNISTSNIPSNQVNCINVSMDNRVWVGTSNGLGIFNGSSWEVFRVDNSDLPNNSINAIKFDVSGVAWIGTNDGFVKFDGVNFQKFNYASSQFTYLWVTSLQFDYLNNLWIGSNNFGFLKFDGNSFTEYVADTVNIFLTNRISSIALDNSGNLWIGQLLTGGIRGGVSLYNGSSFTNHYIGSINNKINSIYTTGSNKWICTSEGLTKYDANNSSLIFSTLNSFLSNDNVTGAIEDLNGNVWITTFGGGLNKFKNQ